MFASQLESNRMAQLNNILRYFAVYCNRNAYMGEVSELKVPDFKLKMEEFRGGGMDIPVEADLGMEKLETEFKLFSWDDKVFRRFGQLGNAQSTPLTFRGHFQSQDNNPLITRVQINMDVRVKDRTSEAWKPGSKAEITIKCAIDFYEEFHNDSLIYRIDPLGFQRIIDGEDQLAEARISLGLTSAN